MSNLDMSEAIKMLAQEKGLSVDALLQVLVEALASAYKRRPDAADEVQVGVDPDTMEFIGFSLSFASAIKASLSSTETFIGKRPFLKELL